MLTRPDNTGPEKLHSSTDAKFLSKTHEDTHRSRRKRLKQEQHKTVEQSMASFAQSLASNDHETAVKTSPPANSPPANSRPKRRKKHGNNRRAVTKLEPLSNRGGYIVASEGLYEQIHSTSGEETGVEGGLPADEDRLLKLPEIRGRQCGGYSHGMQWHKRNGHPGEILRGGRKLLNGAGGDDKSMKNRLRHRRTDREKDEQRRTWIHTHIQTEKQTDGWTGRRPDDRNSFRQTTGCH